MEDKNVLVIERVFDAPVETVWKYFSDPEMYKKWWGPKDFTAPVIKMDFRVGGKFLGAMHGPAGSEFDKDLWSTGTYKEIVPPNPSTGSGRGKIVVTDSFADEHGNIVPSSHYGMEGFPLELQVTFEFESIRQAQDKEVDGKTKMTLHHEGIKDIDEKMRSGMDQGWNQSLDKLADSLK